MSIVSLLVLVVGAATVNAASLIAANKCSESLMLYTESAFGSINNFVNVAPGTSVDMGISSDWIGAISTGTGCNSDVSFCTTGGPTWDGQTPFSRAEFYFESEKVVYDISLVYGYNTGIEISSADVSCDSFACTITSGCPVPGPDGSCFSPCCSSDMDCSNGALPLEGGGCVDNTGPGPNSPFYYTTCPNAYAFPYNDGLWANFVTYSCTNTNLTLTLCPEITSFYTS